MTKLYAKPQPIRLGFLFCDGADDDASGVASSPLRRAKALRKVEGEELKIKKPMKELKEEYKRRIADSLYDLQDMVAEAIKEISEIGVENDEFHSYLDAYEMLVGYAKDALENKYLFWQEREEKEKNNK